ncbi:FeS cluster assembly protein SufB [Posidoniimonas polymericola]|uniref:FeS cluster assembly protein SufB n=1 Tax=Posidoniimonas polymericola TaxID=2528002 RepID=A0A5C5YLT3_9BACT|nr:Fe-S cluster assembly protein SufD [Posidoniimonas polymericola]TWT75815.1 FeS cluster assembly protein SufB [Posidoniimonas polymericola]
MTATLTSQGYDQAAFDALLASLDEPAWMTDRRRDAFEAFANAPWPSSKDEEWMRTDIRLFKLDQFAKPDDAAAAPCDPGLLTHGVDLGGHVQSVDGNLVSEDLSAELAAKGVLFGGMQRMLAEHGDKLRPSIERDIVCPKYDRFAMLNAAFWTCGSVLYVPKGVSVEQPLHMLSVLGAEKSADLSRTLVVLEEGAEATLLAETASASTDAAGLHCGAIELIVGPNAKLRYVNLQNWNNKVWHFAHQKAVVGKQGQLQWTIGALGAKLAKVNQHVALEGSDAEAQVNGAMFTQGRQHLTYNTHQHHEASYCRSDLLYKTALQDKSRTVWRGMIKVDKPAQRTDAYQRNDNLMLSEHCRADSIPGLEIEADDVRCTHGSTSGRVDESQIFYAMTRGYTRQEAVRMIVSGFFQQIFDRITIQSVRDALGEAIAARVQDLSSL